MVRRLILTVLLLAACAAQVSAQVLPTSPKNITLVSSGGLCNTPDTACATYTFGTAPSITFDIGGTFTGTLTFEGTSNGITWRTISVTKLSDGTTATTTTTTGQFSVGNAGLLRVRVRATAAMTGIAVVFGTGGSAVAKILSPTVNSILTGNGTAAAPAWSFTLDPDTGVYRVGADDIGISTGGVLRFDLSTVAVTSTLPFLGPSGSQGAPTYSFSGDSDTGMFNDAGNRVSFTTGGNQRSFINAVGYKMLADANLNFAPAANISTASDTGLSRTGVATLGVGNGTVGDVSGTLASAALSTTAANLFKVDNIVAGPATAPNQAVNIANTTAATASVVAQWSPGLLFSAPGWDVDGAVSQTTHAYFTNRPVSGNTVTNRLLLFMEQSPYAGSYNESFVFANTGNFTALGSNTVGADSAFAVNGRSTFSSTANGLITLAKNAGIAAPAVEMNVGTAVPTVANCSVGSAGSISAHSTNTAGEVNLGSGSTACDVVFGAPAFSFAPFCVITDETSVILAPKISARSTTGFTITGATAGDKFNYICFGGT